MMDLMDVIGNKDFRAVTMQDAEYYRQACLDRGNRPATVKKKLRGIKSVFQLAVKRGMLEDNPLQHISMPKCPSTQVSRYGDKECERILRAAQDHAESCDPSKAVRMMGTFSSSWPSRPA